MEKEIKLVWKSIHGLTNEVKKLSKSQRELFAAQKRTEAAIRSLAIQVGRLADNVGFGLEDIAKVVLPGYFLKHYKIKINTLKREFVELNGNFFEINLYGIGKKNGKKVVIAGECKSRIHLREVKRFDVMLKKLNFKNEVLKFMFGYFIDPHATKEARKRNIVLVTSYPGP